MIKKDHFNFTNVIQTVVAAAIIGVYPTLMSLGAYKEKLDKACETIPRIEKKLEKISLKISIDSVINAAEHNEIKLALGKGKRHKSE